MPERKPMNLTEFMTRMREKPHPRCMMCRKSQRAHGLFKIGDEPWLLCAEHGFDTGANLVRSFNTSYAPPPTEPKPCTSIQLPGMPTPLEVPVGLTASEFLTMLRRQHHGKQE